MDRSAALLLHEKVVARLPGIERKGGHDATAKKGGSAATPKAK